MAEAIINPLHETVSSVNDPDKYPNLDPSTTFFHRRIEFYLARNPFTGFGDGGNSSGFKLETLNPNNANSFSKSQPHRASSASGSGSVKALGSSLENSSGLDSELSFRITFNRIGAGLQNLGNTCFLNSVLQCLTYTEPLAAYLQSGRHKTSCRTTGFCALCAIQKHVSRALESAGRILAPKDLVSNLRCISRNFRISRQEDAHEYMVNLLESMHKCCLPSGVPSESPSAYEKSLVHKIFGGRLRSQVKCMHCSFCSNKFDPFLDLSLEIWKAHSLDKALAHFTAKEQLDGGERQYQCQQCKQKVRALKQLTVYKTPEVLTIHLKRFGSHVNQKIDKHVKFDTTLDLKPYVTGPYDGNLKYTLYGVLVHAGWNTRAGHYYCFVRTSTGNWYSLDDNRVVQVGEGKVLEQKAYMLFYVRDRAYSVSKKNVDVVQKEHFINALGHKAYNNVNHGLKETIQNESFGEKINDSFSAAAAQKHTLNAHFSTKSQTKLDFRQKANDPVAAECSSHKKGHPTETSWNVRPKIDLVDGLPILNLTGGSCLIQSASSVKEKPNDCNSVAKFANMGSNAQKDMAVPLSAEHDYNDPQNTAGEESDSVVIPAICSGKDVNLPNSNFLHRSSGEISILGKTHTREVGGLSGIAGVANSAGSQNGRDVGRGKSVPTAPSLGCKKSVNAKCHLVKKRHFKGQVMRMHLSSSIIFGAALGRKKNKHKRSRFRCAEKCGGNSLLLSDLGPSTSEKSKTPANICSMYPPGIVKFGADEKGNRSSTKNGAGNGDMSRGVMDSELRNSINQDGAALSTERLSQKGSCTTSTDKLSDSGEIRASKGNRKDHMENGLMSMLTRGIEETTVARWDGVELPPSEFVESRSADNISIGYVVDEWDEDYDRGKRKKIRASKLEFGGPNPFQEIAIKKGKIKKHSSSANQPFRI